MAQRRLSEAAAIYVRVATTDQREGGSRLDGQRAACERLAAERGWPVAGVWSDIGDGATLRGRPGLAALRDAIRRGEVTRVVVTATDRLSRSKADAAILLDECARRGVAVEPIGVTAALATGGR